MKKKDALETVSIIERLVFDGFAVSFSHFADWSAGVRSESEAWHVHGPTLDIAVRKLGRWHALPRAERPSYKSQEDR